MNLSWIVKGGQAYKTYDILRSTWAVPHGFSWDVLNNANALVPSCLPVFNSVWPEFLADLSNFHTLTSSAISSAIKLGHKIQIDSQLDIPSGKLTWPMRKPSFLIRDTSSIIFHFPYLLCYFTWVFSLSTTQKKKQRGFLSCQDTEGQMHLNCPGTCDHLVHTAYTNVAWQVPQLLHQILRGKS